jgi:nucleoid DNA-binding protein
MNNYEKPKSMTLKEFFIKKTSLKLKQSERIVELVISNQFTSLFQATSTHNSIELSGFGKFTFLQKKAHRQMDKYESQLKAFEEKLSTSSTPEEQKNLQMRINTVNKNIEHLKPKLR